MHSPCQLSETNSASRMQNRLCSECSVTDRLQKMVRVGEITQMWVGCGGDSHGVALSDELHMAQRTKIRLSRKRAEIATLISPRTQRASSQPPARSGLPTGLAPF